MFLGKKMEEANGGPTPPKLYCKEGEKNKIYLQTKRACPFPFVFPAPSSSFRKVPIWVVFNAFSFVYNGLFVCCQCSCVQTFFHFIHDTSNQKAPQNECSLCKGFPYLSFLAFTCFCWACLPSKARILCLEFIIEYSSFRDFHRPLGNKNNNNNNNNNNRSIFIHIGVLNADFLAFVET